MLLRRVQARRLQSNMQVVRKVPFSDMFLAGVLGVVEAARRYDVTEAACRESSSSSSGRNVRFLTYAQHYVRKAMRQAMKDYDANDVFIPR
jgi:DNA-directed RNA polymerase sigma subunit (sigma70/sigma32)